MSGHRSWPDTRDNRLSRDRLGIDRYLGLWCGCSLVECCHNEDTDQGDRWRIGYGPQACSGRHHHSGSPLSGYTQPWEPEDESWRDPEPRYQPR